MVPRLIARPSFELPGTNLEDLGGRAHDADVADGAAVVRHHLSVGVALHSDPGGHRQPAPDRGGVVERDAGPTRLRAPVLGVGIEVDLGAPAQGDRVDAEDLGREVLADVAVHPLYDAHHDQQEHDADDHAQECEEALQLLGLELLHGQDDAFPDVHRAPAVSSPPRAGGAPRRRS